MKLLTNLNKLFTKTCAAFTLTVIGFTIVVYAPVNTDKNLAPKAEMILSILLFSFIFALTELLYEKWKAGDSTKRIVHFMLNFVNVWISFFLVTGRVRLVKEFIISSFVFMVLYVIVLAITAGLRKLKEKLE